MRGDAGFPVRIRFSKLGRVRFVSHRDVARAFERAFRIERLPLAFTQGFSPRPKVSFGLALGVGHESLAEYLDVELVDPVPVDDLPASLSAALPDGIAVDGVSRLAARAPALQEAITSVEVVLRLDGVETSSLEAAIDRALGSDALSVTTNRKGSTIVEDVRPAIRRLELVDAGPSGPAIAVELATRPRGTRPGDLAIALRDLAGAPDAAADDRVLRTHQWIERDGARHEPLEADRAAHTETSVRASSKGLTNDRRDHTGGDHLRPNSEDEHAEATRRIA